MQHKAERVDIAAGVGLPLVEAELLRAHVSHRAEEFAQFGGGGEPHVAGTDGPSHAEVDHLRLPGGIDEDVARLEIAMHHTLAVGVGQCRGNLRKKRDAIPGRKPPFACETGQRRRVGDQFHDEV